MVGNMDVMLLSNWCSHQTGLCYGTVEVLA